MARIRLEQRFDDLVLRRLIHIGDEIVVLLFRNDDAVDIEGRTVDDGGGAAGGLDGRVEHWVHGGFFRKNANAHSRTDGAP